jgi:HTH-type transcriptional regulator/antitoxin HigA
MITGYKPFMLVGPGDTILAELEAHGWTQQDLAEIIGMSPKTVNQLINHKQPITFETAQRLSMAFGQSVHFWINQETIYRLHMEEQKDISVETRANIYKSMPIREMINKGWLKSFQKIEGLVQQVKKFWDIDTLDFSFLDDKARLPNFRKSEAFEQYNIYFALNWAQMAKKCARKYDVEQPYSKSDLQKLAEDLSEYTIREDGVRQFLNALNAAGVKFFVLSHLQKTYIDGASFFGGDIPVIVYTRRYDRIDNFWFTIAHEIAHVLLHLKEKDDLFIDSQDKDTSDIKVEQEANELAANMVKAHDILEYFRRMKKYISKDRVTQCAQALNVSEALIVGVLQHHGQLSRKNLNRFKTKVSNQIPEQYFVEKYMCGNDQE